MKRIGTTTIKEILQHRHEFGLTRAQTATAVGVSTGTVSHILERASAAGLSWPLPDGLDDEALRARLYPSVARDAGCVQPDWEAVLAELGRKRKRRRTRVTRRQLWVEYRDEARAQGATAYSYSRFCALLNERLDRQGREAQMRFDYAGRGIARTTLTQLATGDWIRQALNLIVEGQTGSGKTFLACALAHQACRQKRSVLYRRVPELVSELSRAGLLANAPAERFIRAPRDTAFRAGRALTRYTSQVRMRIAPSLTVSLRLISVLRCMLMPVGTVKWFNES